MRALIAVIFLLVSGASSIAWQTQEDAPRTENGPSAKGIRLRGCILDDKRTFAQESTGAMFQLDVKDSQVGQYRGKLIELVVKELPPAAKGANQLPIVKVSRVKEIATTCPMQTKNLADPAKAHAIDQGTGSNAPQSSQPIPAGTPNNPNGSGATGAPSPGSGNIPPRPQ
jgi:hypothetical protein